MFSCGKDGDDKGIFCPYAESLQTTLVSSTANNNSDTDAEYGDRFNSLLYNKQRREIHTN